MRDDIERSGRAPLRNTTVLLPQILVLAALAGCSNSKGRRPLLPAFDAAGFSDPADVDHALLGLAEDRIVAFVETEGDERETILIELLSTTRVVNGIDCAVVRDRVYEGGLLVEDTHDFFAQDDEGNVWYMGEEVDNYEYDDDGNPIGVDHEGAWEAGLDVAGVGVIAQPGWLMKAMPAVGDYYYQEHYPGVAEDIGRVLSLAAPVTLGDGAELVCVQIADTSGLEPGALEHKFFAAGLGLVLESRPGSTQRLERTGSFDTSDASLPDFASAAFTAPTDLTNPFFPAPLQGALVYFVEREDSAETIVIERLDAPKTVLGVDCAVIRDRVFEDGLLIEDTRDWFAQDDQGNVWYMGEEVDNYEYDDDGNPIGVDHEGSWEAGLDVAGVGAIAQPGYQMLAVRAEGVSYFQEYYEDEAEDMGLVSGVDVGAELPDGREIDGCVRILDWNPLEPDGLEYKYFAPGIGLVLEEALHEDETAGLVGAFDTSDAAVPDFAAATFGASTLIDNAFFPLPPGATWAYEKATDEGLETVTAEVLPAPRIVLGVDCVAVRVQEFLDGVIQEDTEDWFAQDDAGNVWYLGEAVTNYEYDDDGVLLGTNADGSWEAGLDVAGTGEIAEAGHIMRAAPAVGDAHYQEFYPDEAQDMGYVVALDVEVEVGGEVFTGCLQVLDWTPLEPDQLEYKFYAPGIGLILEHDLTEDEDVELTDTSL